MNHASVNAHATPEKIVRPGHFRDEVQMSGKQNKNEMMFQKNLEPLLLLSYIAV